MRANYLITLALLLAGLAIGTLAKHTRLSLSVCERLDNQVRLTRLFEDVAANRAFKRCDRGAL